MVLSCSSVTRPSSRFPIFTCKWLSTGSVCESMSSRRLTNLWTLGSVPKEPSRPRASSGVDQHRGPSAWDEEEDSESKRQYAGAAFYGRGGTPDDITPGDLPLSLQGSFVVGYSQIF